jgi:hypothetical protein
MCYLTCRKTFGQQQFVSEEAYVVDTIESDSKYMLIPQPRT